MKHKVGIMTSRINGPANKNKNISKAFFAQNHIELHNCFSNQRNPTLSFDRLSSIFQSKIIFFFFENSMSHLCLQVFSIQVFLCKNAAATLSKMKKTAWPVFAKLLAIILRSFIILSSKHTTIFIWIEVHYHSSFHYFPC